MTSPSVPAPLDASPIRQGDPGLLSLALMDARNRTLQTLGHHLEASGLAAPEAPMADPLWVAGYTAWLAEWWIQRNPQRALGPAASPEGVRLPSVLPQADLWFRGTRGAWHPQPPPPDEVRAYMLEQLEGSLDLLDKTDGSDPALHWFRVALLHEDLQGEQLAVIAQARGVELPLEWPPARPQRPAVSLPATRWSLGSPAQGYAPALERPAHDVQVPSFEIDAQAVCWAQFLEFVDDAGYDRPELWHPAGWSWLQDTGRRAPRHVEQIGARGGAVLQTLFGRPTRLAATQPVMHVSWWEADAWARWAGRRLPTEVEWEVAAASASRRGFHWGDVHEWTAGSLRPWDGFVADTWVQGTPLDPEPHWGVARVRRGASFATPLRQKHPRARAFAPAHQDHDFVGFRTCAP